MEVDVLAIQPDLAPGWQEVAGHYFRFAGAVVAHQAELLALLEIEIDVVECLNSRP